MTFFHCPHVYPREEGTWPLSISSQMRPTEGSVSIRFFLKSLETAVKLSSGTELRPELTVRASGEERHSHFVFSHTKTVTWVDSWCCASQPHLKLRDINNEAAALQGGTLLALLPCFIKTVLNKLEFPFCPWMISVKHTLKAAAAVGLNAEPNKNLPFHSSFSSLFFFLHWNHKF